MSLKPVISFFVFAFVILGGSRLEACNFLYDFVVQNSRAPNTDFRASITISEDLVYTHSIIPLNEESYAQLKELSKSSKSLCIKGTRKDDQIYAYSIEVY